MELAGEEKRIQALFSELRLEDQSTTPSFERLWNCARHQEPQPRQFVFVQPLVVLVSIAMIAVVWAAGLWYRTDIANSPIAITISPVVTPLLQPRLEVANKPLRSRRIVHRRNVRPKEVDHTVIQQAEVLASWQSPTGALMESGVGPVLNSLPELTQSVKELESYLSNIEVKELK